MSDPLPTPTTLYVYNDLPYLPPPAAERWPALIAELLRLLHGQPHVRFLEVGLLVERLAQGGAIGTFAQTLAIGASGRRVAELLEAHAGWLARISTVPLSREEQADGGYRIVAGDERAVARLLASTAGQRVAVVDDTVYSGQTLRWLLARLPADARPEIFCLQAVAATLDELSERCPVHAGIVLHGERERDLSVIKASHLFEPGAIRLAGGRLAFYERRAWLDAWFPGAATPIAAICAELRALLPA